MICLTQPDEHRKSMRSSNEPEKTIFKQDCIFCNRDGRGEIRTGGTRTSERTSSFEFAKWQSVLDAAEQRQDEKLLTRIRGQDLFACEAKFHRSCLRSYLQNPDHWRSTNVDNIKSQLELEKAHMEA